MEFRIHEEYFSSSYCDYSDLYFGILLLKYWAKMGKSSPEISDQNTRDDLRKYARAEFKRNKGVENLVR